MHVCIVRINCQNKWAGVNPQLLACNCICAVAVLQHMHASRSPPNILDTGPSDGAPIQHCPRSTGRLCSAFPSQSSFVSLKLSSPAALASLIFQPHNTFRSAAEKFWRKVKPIVAQPDHCHIERRTLGGLGDISVLDGHDYV